MPSVEHDALDNNAVRLSTMGYGGSGVGLRPIPAKLEAGRWFRGVKTVHDGL